MAVLSDNNNNTTKPTPEQVEAVKEATNDMLKEQKEIQDAVKNDEHGVITLEAAVKQLEEIAADAKAENDKKEGKHEEKNEEKKEEETVKEDGQPSAKSVWEVFREAMKEIGKFSDNFLQALKDAPITPETRKHISEKLRDYKDLLALTQLELQKQRLKATKLSNTFDNLIFFILPDITIVKKALDELSDDAAKQRQIQAWARDNKDDFKEQLKIVSDALKDESGKESIRELQKKWKTMQEDLENLMAQVKHDLDEFKRKMAIIIGVALVVTAVLVAVSAVATAGLTGAALPALFSGAGLALTLGGLAVTGATIFGIVLLAEPDILQIIEKSKEETTNVINEGLEKIASQASRVEVMLFQIYSSWAEINGAVTPSEASSWNAIMGPNVKNLVASLRATKKSIDELVDNIKETEDAVSSELDSYTEKIYKPLLRLYQ